MCDVRLEAGVLWINNQPWSDIQAILPILSAVEQAQLESAVAEVLGNGLVVIFTCTTTPIT